MDQRQAAQATPGISGGEETDNAYRCANDVHNGQHDPNMIPAGKEARARRFAWEAGMACKAEIQVELDGPNKGGRQQPERQQTSPSAAISRR
jgi:hypothetical protein